MRIYADQIYESVFNVFAIWGSQAFSLKVYFLFNIELHCFYIQEHIVFIKNWLYVEEHCFTGREPHPSSPDSKWLLCRRTSSKLGNTQYGNITVTNVDPFIQSISWEILLTWINFIPAWMIYFVHCKVCRGSTNPFPNFKGAFFKFGNGNICSARALLGM